MNAHHTRASVVEVDDADLRRIDPTHGAPDRSRSAAAEQMLARILATPRTTSATDPAAPRRKHSPAGRRVLRPRGWAKVGLATAAAASVVLVPTVISTKGSTAFASWTPEPQILSATASAALQDDCLTSAGAMTDGSAATTPTAGFSETRGDYTFTLVATGRGVGSCFLLDEAPVGPRGEQERGANTWAAASDLPAPTPDGTSVVWGASFSSAAGTYTSAMGRIGSEVTGVTLIAADGRRVQASADQGYFLAWWPGEGGDELTLRSTLVDGSTTSRVLRTGEN